MVPPTFVKWNSVESLGLIHVLMLKENQAKQALWAMPVGVELEINTQQFFTQFFTLFVKNLCLKVKKS